jgi:hypothetical protein
MERKEIKRRQSSAFQFQCQDPKEMLMAVPIVVKNRTGSVLSRGMILKADHFDAVVRSKSDIKLQGAPNFRMADANIFGVAQPTVLGYKTVLTLLQCCPANKHNNRALWINTREEPLVYLDSKPYVIRDSLKPLRNIDSYQGIRINRIEQMEDRLAQDILAEIEKWNGMILVHGEVNKTVVPYWAAVSKVQTPKQVFQELRDLGFQVDYERIPITPEQAPQDIHIDEFVKQIRSRSNTCPIIFNCGIGLGRTTTAMVMALICRRHSILNKEGVDHFAKRTMIMEQNVEVVELLQLLDTAFEDLENQQRSAIEWAMARSPILGNLHDCMRGNYRIVNQLMSLLDKSKSLKGILDEAIDRCGLLINLRKIILVFRLRYSLTGSEEILTKAAGCLIRYLSLLAFCSYLQEQTADPNQKFSEWLVQKADVRNLLVRIGQSQVVLELFQPCDDLSVFSNQLAQQGLSAWGPQPVQLATELDKFVIKARKGNVLAQNMILKEDFWVKQPNIEGRLKGASNFR